MSDPSMLRKIRGLLTKAESTPYGPEQDLLQAKASELMAQYRITEAMLAAGKSDSEDRKVVTRSISIGAGPYVRARLHLLAGIADVFDAQTATWAGWDGRTVEITAMAGDLEAIEVLYTSLLIQATEAAVQNPTPPGENTTAWRRAFMFGFSQAARERVREAHKAAVSDAEAANSEGMSVSLVLADRANLVNEAFRRRYPKLRTMRSTNVRSAEGFTRGTAAGAEADIGQERINRGRRSLESGK